MTSPAQSTAPEELRNLADNLVIEWDSAVPKLTREQLSWMREAQIALRAAAAEIERLENDNIHCTANMAVAAQELATHRLNDEITKILTPEERAKYGPSVVARLVAAEARLAAARADEAEEIAKLLDVWVAPYGIPRRKE